MSVLSPWQWFFSTRTFSNCLEMTLTLATLYLWPWSLLSNAKLYRDYNGTSEKGTSFESEMKSLKQSSKSTKQLRLCLLLAGTASILRPTNLLIWISLLVPQISDLLTRKPRLPSIGNYFFLIREGLLCSAFLLIISAIFDRFYFTAWIFPPYNWLHFNLVQDIAVFYGTNTWHYYLTQALPQLLVTYLPFTLISIWNMLTLPSNDIRFVLTTTTVITVGFLSLISHKEVRFIYPLLPIFFILTAPTITQFFITKPSVTKQDVKNIKPTATANRFKFRHVSLLLSLLLINVLTAFYVTTIHQSGVIAIMPYIRKKFETSRLTKDTSSLLNNNLLNDSIPYVAFLMPCHSTPFRSALIYPNLTAWALSCSPPLHIPPHTTARINYRDEADRFYDDPIKFLKQEVGTKEGRNWPHFIAGFEGIESELRQVWESYGQGQKTNKIVENKRIFNSHWHDDPRRKGDVVLWELIRGLQE
ncbi:hypothetical protein EPUL_002832 [Erysiphe pulchra]|uniref:Mannosyltransferase n=1 Tax=Erysiphe pulchra TaxID=225359 RepID=A0A2S4PWX0_9PEZI|nr:hypothetical protein EPUL_002832 [Erysiphe pulchra]